MSAAVMTDRSVDHRTQALLDAPLLPLLLRLAAPTTGLIETYFVGKLGTEALAGVSIVFPGVMLMQMISTGAMGGGISSSIARALGSGRQDDASDLVWHALVINGVLGLVCTAAVLTFGESLYL